LELEKNNTSKYNTGKLPTVALNGGYTYNLDNTTANFQDGRSTTLTFAPSQAANVSVNAGYVIFDGYFRKHNINQLQERFELSEIAVKASMENVAAQTLSQYYQIAVLAKNLDVRNQAIEISKQRVQRVALKLEFGQGSQLELLNAQVDLNNDSLAFFNTDIAIQNAKRLLNNLMVSKKDINYTVDTVVNFLDDLSYSDLKEKMLAENLALAQQDKMIQIGALSIDLANARKLPTLRGDLSYGYAYSKNNSASFLASVNNNGLTAGLSVSWNVFDGGQTKHSLEQARLTNINLVLEKEQLIQNLELQFETAWANYQDRTFIYKSQEKNLDINQSNFKRTEEQFKIGQINSVDFRQAQLNLLNAEVALNAAKFQVKIAEVELLLLSGNLLN